jgi:hypothetical protein
MASVSADTVMTALAAGFAVAFALTMALTFEMKLETDVTFYRTCDPGYPFLLALARHTFNGGSFLGALSQAVITNNTEIVRPELEKFDESFRLINSQGETILSMGSVKGKSSVLAVPPGGKLVVTYDMAPSNAKRKK